jgi:hypothetical protein
MTTENKELTLDQLDKASGGHHPGRHPVVVGPVRAAIILASDAVRSFQASFGMFR